MLVETAGRTVDVGTLSVPSLESSEFQDREPGLPVRVGVEDLICHNTLVLGTTGAGKTVAVSGLIEQLRDAHQHKNGSFGILILDVTGQWGNRLGKESVFSWPYAAGSDDPAEKHPHDMTDAALQERMDAKDPQKVKQLNEAARKLYRDRYVKSDVTLVALRAYEWSKAEGAPVVVDLSGSNHRDVCTAAVLEALLSDVSQTEHESARCLVVLEEAHSLIPEGKREAVGRSARVLMQGRKFGMGGIVISQRVASVTKDVTSVCNSVIAFRAGDAGTRALMSESFGVDGGTEFIAGLPDHVAVIAGRVLGGSPLVLDSKKPKTFDLSP